MLRPVGKQKAEVLILKKRFILGLLLLFKMLYPPTLSTPIRSYMVVVVVAEVKAPFDCTSAVESFLDWTFL